MRARLSRGSVSRLLSLACAGALTPACGLITPIPPDARVVPVESGVDDAMAPPDDAGPSADADVGDAGPSGEADADAAGPSVDADVGDASPSGEADADAGPSVDADGDAAPSADAAPPGDANATGCATDEQCSPAEYCSRLSQRCAPRCDAEGTCVGPGIAARNNRIVTDGMHVCYAGDGPEAGQYTIFAWDGASATARALASGQNALALQIADGHCYFHADGALQRALVTGGAPETVQPLASAPTRSWLTAGHVWCAVVSGEESQLFRLPRRAGAVPEQVVSGPAAELWEVGNSTQLFRRFNPSYAKCAIAVAPIDDPSNFTTIPMSFSKNCTGALWASEESIVFTQFEPVHHYPFRVDLNNPGKEVIISLSSVETLMYQVRGGWLYGQRVIDGSSVPGVNNTVSYLRVPISGGAEVASELLFMPTPGSAAFYVEPASFKDNVHRTFAVLDGPRLVYQHKRESRLLTHALPAEPAL